MGTYLNPGNSGFDIITQSNYVDKTRLIKTLNSIIGTTKNLTCISRARRFGKSYAAQMLCAYYDKTCNSHDLFAPYDISKEKTYDKYLNKFHVISLDISGFVSEARKNGISLREVPKEIEKAIIKDLEADYPDMEICDSLSDRLLKLVEKTNTKVVFVIDEWDSMIRETKNDAEAQTRYLSLLRGWFKNNNFTPKVVALAYMTGILPIKKDGSQSAISDFQEYTMLEPGPLAKYVGFTEEEVQDLCKQNGKNFTDMKKWYDGYTVGECKSIYNPYSVMQALESGKFRSYWKKTSAADSLKTYIDMDQDGLQEDIIRLIAGEEIEVDTGSFQNDVETFTCKDDVLTLLIHLGYLTYEEVSDSYDEDEVELTGIARIPNEEIRTEFDQLLHKAKHKELVKLVNQSDELLDDTIAGNCEKVAKAVQEIHDSNYAPTYYNNEQSLRYVIKMAYITCVDQYDKIEELPSGHGIADTVFLPRRRSSLPAMIIELKWNKSKEGALKQIKEKNYPKVLRNYGGDIILVGINYDSKTKKHTCIIEVIYK